MEYKELISEMVSKSKLTLREISDKARDRGVSIDPSYISKLQTGKQPPASEEVSRTIAEICNSDPDELIWEGYMEKAPTVIREFINNTLDYYRNLSINLLKQQLPKEIVKIAVEDISKKTPLQFIREINKMNLNSLEFDNNSFIIKSDIGEDKIIFANFTYQMEDESMSPLIPNGSKVTIIQKHVFKNGDLALMINENNNYLLRRLVLVEDKYFLIAENKNFETLVYDKEAIKLIGIVDSITYKL